MRLRILAFASASDAVGAAESSFDLADGSRLGDLRRALLARYRGQRLDVAIHAFAIDGEIAGADQALREGAEVALLPPVSGG